MKYLGKAEVRLHHKTHTGYKVFNFRMNEYELDTIAFLLDLHKNKTSMQSKMGEELQVRMRGLRKGIAEAKRDMEK